MAIRRKKSIVYLKRSQLEQHPDNPRKDLGDLEELRESIRENGIMQNLTVIPTDDSFEHFRILIGHRRFAASEGIIDELPCVIVEGLTDKEQLGIMLCENMQRSDLTFIEQAHGFQLMLDLGDTVEEIANKTGFSEATVKHRLKINEIDREVLDEAQEYFQLTIGDFVELEKVKDIDMRNEILRDASNSAEIKDGVQNYLEKLEQEKNTAQLTELFKELGWKESKDYFHYYGGNWEQIGEGNEFEILKFDNEMAKRIRAIAKKEQGGIYYRFSWRYVEIARKITKEEKKAKKKTKAELRQEQIDQKGKQLEIARRDLCDAYLVYIKELPDEKIRKLNASEQLALAERLWNILETCNGSVTTFRYMAKSQYKTKEELEGMEEFYKGAGYLRRLMLQVWATLATSYSNKFVNYSHEKKHEVIDAHADFYDILHIFGMKLDHNLKEVIDETSELYLIDGKEVKE